MFAYWRKIVIFIFIYNCKWAKQDEHLKQTMTLDNIIVYKAWFQSSELSLSFRLNNEITYTKIKVIYFHPKFH